MYWQDIPTFSYIPLPFDALSDGNPSSYRVHIWYGKTRMAGLQSGEGRMMIDSVVWAQYINVTDTQIPRQPRRRSKNMWGVNYASVTDVKLGFRRVQIAVSANNLLTVICIC